MDPSFSNFYMNLGGSGNYTNSQYQENSPIYLNSSQVPITENLETSRNTKKYQHNTKWDVAEDIALMSLWCLASESKTRGKDQRSEALWKKVKRLYNEAQAKNPEKLGERNIEQMKGRITRLNKNAQKWVGAYREAYRRKKSGMSLADIEVVAHTIYQQDVKRKFVDCVVFNEVMCKHPKWELQLHHDTTRPRPECEVDNEESGGSTKRSRTTEERDYSNPETPTSGGSTLQRITGKDAAKAKGKAKASDAIAEELIELRLTQKDVNELFKRKLDMDKEKQRYMEERDLKKMQLVHLNSLLLNEHLSPDEEDMKNKLISKYYQNIM